MAGINRALRRRLLWTLVAAVLGAAILTGCGDHLSCPESDIAVDVDGASGVEACVVPTDETGWSHLRVRNRTGAPITVWGPSTRLPWIVQPDRTVDITVDITLVDSRPGNVISFKPDLQAGVAKAVLGWLDGKAQPGAEWTSCAQRPDEQCLVGLAAQALPSRVEIGHMSLPARQIGAWAATLFSNESLVSNAWDQASGQKGTLTLRQKF